MSLRLTALSLSLWCSGLLCGCSAQTTPADSTVQQAHNVTVVEVPGPEPEATTPELEEPEPEEPPPEPEPEPPRARKERVPPEPEPEEPPPPPSPMFRKPTAGSAVMSGTGKHRPGVTAARGPVARGRVVGPNLAKRPRLIGRPQCPFPAQGLQAGIDKATVVLRVSVKKDGQPKSVHLVSDPGFGFGSTAVGCMLKSRFVPARDNQGKPVATSVTIRFRFQQ